jgi:hypothetical protein
MIIKKNQWLFQIGKWLQNRFQNVHITEPSVDVFKTYAIHVKFLANGVKHVIVLTGDYKNRYREHKMENKLFTEEEMLALIQDIKPNKWIKMQT